MKSERMEHLLMPLDLKRGIEEVSKELGVSKDAVREVVWEHLFSKPIDVWAIFGAHIQQRMWLAQTEFARGQSKARELAELDPGSSKPTLPVRQAGPPPPSGTLDPKKLEARKKAAIKAREEGRGHDAR